MKFMYLREPAQEALAIALQARDAELEARERATQALRDAVASGVPQTQLSKMTGIPRMTLIRRLKGAS